MYKEGDQILFVRGDKKTSFTVLGGERSTFGPVELIRLRHNKHGNQIEISEPILDGEWSHPDRSITEIIHVKA